MRCSATVVLPEPAVPRMTTGPLVGRVISANCSGSISAGDVGQVLVGAPMGRRGVGAEAPRRASRRRDTRQRRAFAAGEPRRLALAIAQPSARCGVGAEHAFRRLDALQRARRGWSPCGARRRAAARAAGDLLLVRLALP